MTVRATPGVLVSRVLLESIVLFSSYRFTHFNLRLFMTTLTELRAIAAPAIIGSSKKPLMGYNTPAASGMPMMLYTNAQKDFDVYPVRCA